MISWTGLSPRVRGNRPDHRQVRPQVGSIPACAGEPLTYGFKTTARRVYPRVCGGTKLRIAMGRLTNGLSPRVRGNPSRWAR